VKNPREQAHAGRWLSNGGPRSCTLAPVLTLTTLLNENNARQRPPGREARPAPTWTSGELGGFARCPGIPPASAPSPPLLAPVPALTQFARLGGPMYTADSRELLRGGAFRADNHALHALPGLWATKAPEHEPPRADPPGTVAGRGARSAGT
jgi:hypothetical protein